jgi:hypothetical protein
VDEKNDDGDWDYDSQKYFDSFEGEDIIIGLGWRIGGGVDNGL